MTKLEKFFVEHAGCGWNPEIETEEQGRVRGAKSLAKAMHHALDQGWIFEWGVDDEACNCGKPRCGHMVEVCQVRDASNGNLILASLSGISGASAEYRRVVEAELALEAMELRRS